MKTPYIKKRFYLTLMACAVTVCASAQVLDSMPDYDGREREENEGAVQVKEVDRVGATFSGSGGLITIPTPDFQNELRTRISYKGGVSEHDLSRSAGTFETKKNEHWSSLAYAVMPNLEVSVNHLEYERNSFPYLRELNYREDSTGFGMKYSTHIASQDLCFGGILTPMEASELNAADLTQIEHLRNIYLTMGEQLTDDIRGYLHLKECFTDRQKLVLPFGEELKIDRKEFLIGAVAFEYAPSRNFSFIFESEFMNYRDFFVEEGDRVSINLGIRGGIKGFEGEVTAFSVNDKPDLRFGVNIAF